jgi:hypothetical protein
MSNLKILATKLKDDPVWRKFRVQMRDLQQYDFEKLMDEIKTMHKTRSVRMLGAMTQSSAKKVGDAASQEIAVRSRCIEISLDAVILRNAINGSVGTLKKHIEASYPKTLRGMGITTVTARRNLLDALTDRYLDKYDTLMTLIEVADLVVADIDQAGYAIKHITEAVGIATKREFGV